MSDRSPEREVAHLRYQLAAERAAGARRDADLGRLRTEVARLAILAGERQAPPPIVVPEPPASRAWTPPPQPERAKPKAAAILPRGWLSALLRERGPMTTVEMMAASGCSRGACMVALRRERAELTSERTGRRLELRYRLQDQAAPVPYTPRGPRGSAFGRAWLLPALTAEPQSIDELMAKTGRTRASLYTALSENRSRIIATGPRRSRVYALAAPLAQAG